jgi:UDP-3-O-[3-hydroxymyristoyl] glucosamine N-acyltransferase
MKIIHKIIRKLRKFLNKLLRSVDQEEKKKRADYEYLINQGIETELGYVSLGGLPIVQKHSNARIIIGKEVTLLSDSKYNCAGINHSVILATCADGAVIELKDGCGLSGTTIVSVEKVEIGINVNIGVNVNIYDTDFHPIDYMERRKNPGFDLSKISHKPVIIGDDVWIGANAIILKGVELGERVIVAAGSVVTKSFPANSLIGGNPARLLREI